MALVDDIKDMLDADATFTGYMTGGVYTRSELGPEGVSRDTNASIFDATTLRLKPVCIVNARDALGTPAIRDNVEQKASVRQAVEIYFYADHNAGHTTLRLARERAYALLHGKRTASGAHLIWIRDVEQQYDNTLDKACFERSDFDTYRVKG